MKSVDSQHIAAIKDFWSRIKYLGGGGVFEEGPPKQAPPYRQNFNLKHP